MKEAEIKQAEEILKAYLENDPIIDEGNLFFAASVFQEALATLKDSYLIKEKIVHNLEAAIKAQEIGLIAERAKSKNFKRKRIKEFGELPQVRLYGK